MLVEQQQTSQHTLVKISDLLFSKLGVALDSCRRSVEASRGLLFQTQMNDDAAIDLHPMELERLLLDLRGQAFKTNVRQRSTCVISFLIAMPLCCCPFGFRTC
jgi:hypothetical protein